MGRSSEDDFLKMDVFSLLSLPPSNCVNFKNYLRISWCPRSRLDPLGKLNLRSPQPQGQLSALTPTIVYNCMHVVMDKPSQGATNFA